jgi:hypothetical protein
LIKNYTLDRNADDSIIDIGTETLLFIRSHETRLGQIKDLIDCPVEKDAAWTKGRELVFID